MRRKNIRLKKAATHCIWKSCVDVLRRGARAASSLACTQSAQTHGAAIAAGLQRETSAD